jgi:hypothetical protein
LLEGTTQRFKVPQPVLLLPLSVIDIVAFANEAIARTKTKNNNFFIFLLP